MLCLLVLLSTLCCQHCRNNSESSIVDTPCLSLGSWGSPSHVSCDPERPTVDSPNVYIVFFCIKPSINTKRWLEEITGSQMHETEREAGVGYTLTWYFRLLFWNCCSELGQTVSIYRPLRTYGLNCLSNVIDCCAWGWSQIHEPHPECLRLDRSANGILGNIYGLGWLKITFFVLAGRRYKKE